LASFAVALPALIAAALLARLAFAAFGFGIERQAPILLTAQFLAYGIWFFYLHLHFKLRYGRPLLGSLGWTPLGERFLQRVGWGFVLAAALAILGTLLRTPDVDMPMKQILSSRLAVLLVGIAAATVGPLCEELAFRGFLMPVLVRSLGPPAGIVLSSLPFALLHGPQYGWSWRHVLLITAAGAGFGYVRYRTGSTTAATVVHAAYNSTLFLAYVIYGKDLPARW
jgi:membrane protease YdiL (CAAX protease family)